MRERVVRKNGAMGRRKGGREDLSTTIIRFFETESFDFQQINDSDRFSLSFFRLLI